MFRIGLLSKGTFTTAYTHRLAWLIAHPTHVFKPGECVLHSCDNPPCCRVSHLYLGTRTDNNRDKVAKGRQAKIRGERNCFSKLTESQVYEIRDSKELRRVLAARHGVSMSQISAIWARKAWGWLEEDDLEALFG